jgi:hypothetical protein
VSSEKVRIKSAASSAWHVPSVIFGGCITKLSDQTLIDIEFKRFCEILIAQIEQGIDPNKIEWEPVEATVTHPLEYGTPIKVQFQGVPLGESLELEGWTDVSPRGSTREDDARDPLLNDKLRTTQLVVNMQLL